METVFAAVDHGDTTITAALGTASGGFFDSAAARIAGDAAPEDVRSLIGTLLEALARRTGRPPAALGAAIPGLADPTAAAFLEHRLGIAVRLLERSRCEVLGERNYGHGREYSSFVYYSLGTRIGGGIVIDGRLRLGPLGVAGALGHQILLPGGPICRCGNAGCLETLASGLAIARAAGCLDAESAAAAARDGDERAQNAFRDAANYLGIAAANLVTAFHPDAVLFGGDMAEAVDLLLVPVRAAVNEHVRPFPANEVAVRRAGAGPDAVLLGALALNAAPDTIAL